MCYLINYQRQDVNKIYLYIEDKFESQYQEKRKNRYWNQKCEISKSIFCGDSQAIDDVYENFEDYNPTNKRKVLAVFDDMLADKEANTKLSPFLTELS